MIALLRSLPELSELITRERLTLVFLLGLIFLIRAIHADQPIVENYVGRQIPTAMVARNLERGSDFFHPELDTAPFPNWFLVEPPIYAQVVASFRRTFDFELEPTGRIVSALATTLAAWGLFGLVRRREGVLVGFLALGSFGFFPVMIRYGRAFQPDALMLGCVLAGLRGWDDYAENGDRRWAWFGGFVLAIGLAIKITVAWALIPFFLITRKWTVSRRLTVATLMLIPAGLWYLYAWNELAVSNRGSMANAESTSIWMNALFSTRAWVRFATYDNLARSLFVRSFTPIGFVLACYGLVRSGKVDRVWLGWAVGCSLSIIGLASKWHHAYYWMVVAPLAAVGVGRGLVRLASWGRWGRTSAIVLASFFLAMCVERSASTFRTPVEWESLNEAARELRAMNQVDQLILAPEAVLYAADLKGYRLEFHPQSMQRAASEWGVTAQRLETPLALTEFYWEVHWVGYGIHSPELLMRLPGFARVKTSLLVADVGLIDHDLRRKAWRKAMRSRPKTKILADKPGYLIAELY